MDYGIRIATGADEIYSICRRDIPPWATYLDGKVLSAKEFNREPGEDDVVCLAYDGRGIVGFAYMRAGVYPGLLLPDGLHDVLELSGIEVDRMHRRSHTGASYGCADMMLDALLSSMWADVSIAMPNDMSRRLLTRHGFEEGRVYAKPRFSYVLPDFIDAYL